MKETVPTPSIQFTPEIESKIKELLEPEFRRLIDKIHEENEKPRKQKRKPLVATMIAAIALILLHVVAAGIWWGIEPHADIVIKQINLAMEGKEIDNTTRGRP